MCGGIVVCKDLDCPNGVSTSCSKGECLVDCKGGGGEGAGNNQVIGNNLIIIGGIQTLQDQLSAKDLYPS